MKKLNNSCKPHLIIGTKKKPLDTMVGYAWISQFELYLLLII